MLKLTTPYKMSLLICSNKSVSMKITQILFPKQKFYTRNENSSSVWKSKSTVRLLPTMQVNFCRTDRKKKIFVVHSLTISVRLPVGLDRTRSVPCKSSHHTPHQQPQATATAPAMLIKTNCSTASHVCVRNTVQTKER